MSFNALLQIKEFQQIAPYATSLLIAFLGLTSQWLFARLDPEPLARGQILKFNFLIASLVICYYRTCTLDPGRIDKDWDAGQSTKNDGKDEKPEEQVELDLRRRWCRRCEMLKPPRAHHCKTCGRCIPKMDHHCPWTANCVSHRIMPHFIRFLFYATSALAYLQYFICIRLYALWQKRLLPSFCCTPQYLGPTVTQMVILFLLTIVNAFTFIGLSLMFIRTTWCILVNTTTIEGWEIERHETLVRRAKYHNGFLDGPDGTQIRITKQEFPYDIGFWSNLVQTMGSPNPIVWLFPLAPSIPINSGTSFAVNGFEDQDTTWPPPDPDRLFRVERKLDPSQAFTKSMNIEDFRARQAEDLKRHQRSDDVIRRRKPFHVRLEERQARDRQSGRENEKVYEINTSDEDEYDDGNLEEDDRQGSRPAHIVDDDDDGEEAWRNAEGERLADFGVDEDVEFYDEDDIPLAELLRRRRGERDAVGGT
ncbi:DHHC palmitoyltransferase-domain-containing protein [Elsinoe ampelina]|uniref:Palmitoyltransferase PFA4 n=1 Tax=Elsinoe ampelina TaxID=302913 RepID=A0A6A6G8M0_9PEZI|nr:DHHC palmitoyltransferase-domain-containing protein [Elsinoe ampelina]